MQQPAEGGLGTGNATRTAEAVEPFHDLQIVAQGFGREAGQAGAVVVAGVEACVSRHVAAQKTAVERTVGYEADAQLHQNREDGPLRLPPHEMVLALHGRDGLHGMGTADGSRTHFTEAEVFDLAFTDEVAHGTGHILNRYGGVESVLIEEIDGLHTQALEGFFGHAADGGRSAVQLSVLIDAVDDAVSELGADGYPAFVGGERLSDQFFIGQGAVYLGRVEQGDTVLHGLVQ